MEFIWDNIFINNGNSVVSKYIQDFIQPDFVNSFFFSLEKEQENYDSPSPDTSIWRKDKW